MSASRLAEVNNLSIGSRLVAGQALLVQAPGQAGNRVGEVDAATLAGLGLPDDSKTAASATPGRVYKSVAASGRVTPKPRPPQSLPTVASSKPAAAKQATRSRNAKPSTSSRKTFVARVGR
jgi:hypothetical protein